MPLKGAIGGLVDQFKRGTSLLGQFIGADQMASGRVVVVAGATGYIGQLVVDELVKRKYIVRALVRPTADPTKVVRCDVTNAASLVGKMQGAVAVVTCLGAKKDFGTDGTFSSVDRDATLNIWQAIKQEQQKGRPKVFVVLGTFEGPHSRNRVPMSFAKEAAIDRIRSEAAGADVRLAVVRPTAYFRDMVDFFYRRVASYKIVPLVWDGSTRINPVDGRDVAYFIADCVGQPHLQGDLDVGGPETFRWNQIADLAGNVAQRRPLVLYLPEPCLWLAIAIFALSGYFSRWAANVQGGLLFMLWCFTHDAIATCRGQRSLQNAFNDVHQAAGNPGGGGGAP
eukprot:jgi/Botrbrau1/9886/Bobra.0080s0019.2